MEDFKNWQSSGRFIPRKEFMTKFPTEKLQGACDDVLVYDGGYFIQVLWGGTYYECNTNQSKKIEEVERNLYSKKVMQKLDK